MKIQTPVNQRVIVDVDEAQLDLPIEGAEHNGTAFLYEENEEGENYFYIAMDYGAFQWVEVAHCRPLFEDN